MKKFFLVLASAFFLIFPVSAHANLQSSEPAANALLTASPAEIRLWFTEPLETAFSTISLRASEGTIIPNLLSQVDSSDSHQMFLTTDSLPDGLYTVTWRAVSSADGHATTGSFSFGINVAVSNTQVQSPTEAVLRPDAVAVRTFNLFAASLALGSIAFAVFVWQPLMKDKQNSDTWLYGLIWIGWLALVISSLLFLMLQTSVTADIPFWESLTNPALGTILSQTGFGNLWLIRMLLWLLTAISLLFARRQKRILWLSLLMIAALLLTHSLFSHASASQDANAAIASAWLHLLATAVWLGGLISFFLALAILKRQNANFVETSAELVAYFSNYARVAVSSLVLTGTYAAWLHVGSIPALLNTLYGQSLLVKLLLFLPLLGLAAVNFFLTHRRLAAGESLWFGRLRALIAAEIALVFGILFASAILTSASPARGVQAQVDIPIITPEPYFAMEHSSELMLHLEVSPAVVGLNEFRVGLYDINGVPINDASVIRLRFDNLDENLGQSELRPEFVGDGLYTVTGANLSVAGNWRIRMTVQRPQEFDSLADFEIAVDLAPSPTLVEMQLATMERFLAASLLGLGLLAFGAYFFFSSKQVAGRVLAGAAILVALVCLFTAASFLLFPPLGQA